MFDVFHSWTTERLVRERDELVAKQRRLHARELAVLAALDERVRVDCSRVDDHGARVALGRRAPALSPKIARAVALRDGHWRIPGCTPTWGLEIHHLEPRSWGASDDIANLAAVCPTHHRQLVPHGRWKLIDPNLPDGLTVVDADDLPPPPRGE